MQTTNNKLALIIAELDTLESQRRAMLDEYMPIKNRIVVLTEEKELLEEQLLSEDQVETDKRFDEIMANINEPAVKNGYIGELIIEEEQLIDEIKNPEDYTNFDTKDLESSIV